MKQRWGGYSGFSGHETQPFMGVRVRAVFVASSGPVLCSTFILRSVTKIAYIVLLAAYGNIHKISVNIIVEIISGDNYFATLGSKILESNIRNQAFAESARRPKRNAFTTLSSSGVSSRVSPNSTAIT